MTVIVDGTNGVNSPNFVPTGNTIPISGVFLPTANAVAFSTASVEVARFDASGNFLVGGTTVYGQITSAKGTAGYCFATNSIANQPDHMLFTNSGTTVGSITRSGGTQVNYNTSSDYRLKDNIVPMTGALEKVSQLKPCTYTWKLDGSAGQGFIAHELQSVFPDAVHGEKDAVDSNGNVIPQGIDQSKLVATLVAAIQELNSKIELQAIEIVALKQKT